MRMHSERKVVHVGKSGKMGEEMRRSPRRRTLDGTKRNYAPVSHTERVSAVSLIDGFRWYYIQEFQVTHLICIVIELS